MVKQGIRKLSRGTLQDRLSRFLFQYRMTPPSTTGTSPTEMLLGRKIRSRLEIIRPDMERRGTNAQFCQKLDHDKHSSNCKFTPGDKVYLLNRRPGPKWLTGILLKATGPVSYVIRLCSGRVVHCHQDQLRGRSSNSPGREDAHSYCHEDECLVRHLHRLVRMTVHPLLFLPQWILMGVMYHIDVTHSVRGILHRDMVTCMSTQGRDVVTGQTVLECLCKYNSCYTHAQCTLRPHV